ncbi:MAG: TMEM165/GDT1 family protein [Clostridia bacterium]|jgi:putative Ca2+/H+ antiporter (TMEM165/GDT1 family)|nr:TMEM165/GDT1 family protein [Clostridia bacterium]
MELIYPFLIAFSMVFVSELGDKTQLLVLSFSNKGQTFKILLGVAIGSFFSHGIAILFGSSVHLFANSSFHFAIHLITYLSFLLIGFVSLLPPKNDNEDGKKDGLIYKISHLKLNYCLIIALCIMVGELGDKTFLASIGLGVQYPHSKIALIAGAICAMVICDFIAILFGKFLNKYISEKTMQKLSGILFLLFGMIGILGILV